MLQLPAGFDVSVLLSDLFTISAPFAGLILLVSAGFLVLRVIRSGS